MSLVEATKANVERARADLEAARARGDHAAAALLDALVDSPGDLVLYHPEHDHYGVALGDLVAARHIAVVVPGVGRDANLVSQWLPWAHNLYDETVDTAVVLWKGYDDPPGLAIAALDIAFDDRRAEAGAERLSEFVTTLRSRPGQTLTVVAHSFGSLVAGEAVANYGMDCTDLIVLGSPGIGVENLEQLHLEASHFFAEKAPQDVVAGLGAIGADPASLAFGATRLATNAAGRPEVVEHSGYFTRGSAALANMGDVVMGRYGAVVVQRGTLANAVGNLVATLVKTPALPVTLAARRYTGPGFRLLRIVDSGVHLLATEAGALVRDGLQRVLPGAHPDPGTTVDVDSPDVDLPVGSVAVAAEEMDQAEHHRDDHHQDDDLEGQQGQADDRPEDP